MAAQKDNPTVLPLSRGVTDVPASKALRQLELLIKNLHDRIKALENA